jgi:MazG family protein
MNERKAAPAARHDAGGESGQPAGVAAPEAGAARAARVSTSHAGRGIEELLRIMAALRDPDTGCAWDKVQTFSTIAPYTIEEAYEVADAIERGDLDDLKDELGDLLLQVVYHAQMAAELGAFAFEDVAEAICRKLIRRHPHVFGAASGSDHARQWDAIKAEERAEKAARKGEPEQLSLFADIPAGLPALTRSAKLQKRARKLGFDWRELPPLLAKVDEEWAELRAEIGNSDAAGAEARMFEEFGDLLFVLTNLGLHLGVDADAALRAANAKFVRRMTEMERLARENGRELAGLALDEMEALWQRAKLSERRE